MCLYMYVIYVAIFYHTVHILVTLPFFLLENVALVSELMLLAYVFLCCYVCNSLTNNFVCPERVVRDLCCRFKVLLVY